VTLPEPFSLELGEDMDQEVQRGQDVQIVWEPAGSGSVAWAVDGDCVWMEHGSTTDDGSLSLDAEDVRVHSLDEGETCEVTVTVERTARGRVDPAFEEGGVIEATQRRRVTFSSTPGPDEEGYEPSGTGGSSSGTGGSPSTDAGAGGAEPAAGGAGGSPGSEVGGSAGSA
jgi:hypothetical protein